MVIFFKNNIYVYKKSKKHTFYILTKFKEPCLIWKSYFFQE